MDSSKAIDILSRQRDLITRLKSLRSENKEFTKWHRDTEVAIEKIFGSESRHLSDFSGISYSLEIVTMDTSDSEFERPYISGLETAYSVLSSLIDEVSEYGLSTEIVSVAPDSISVIERICLRFHSVARQLRVRHNSRPTLEIEDEYDVQDLLHALLKLHFDDLRPEEWTPSYAGGSSRVDFLLKRERIVVEVKKTRASLRMQDIGAQLLVDIARYQHHPDCGYLVCFIYDPEGRIGNPVGLERDLEAASNLLKIRTIIAPKSA